jgi:solute carrier family 25 aspartate/glutamate transporter 12/13
MEASIIFHFAGRGNGAQRLAMPDFAQLLDPRWTPPADEHLVTGSAPAAATNWASEVGHGLWNFGIGGIAGAFGATFVYPIDLGKRHS